MGEKRNYAALDWVIGEIGETLKDARQSLDAYVEDPRDKARIRFCLTHIHQVHGSLQMVEFQGASLFAEEMEALAESLMLGQVTNEKEAQEALMRALLQLPLYLERARSQHDDHPGVVLPLLNDLRAVRKQPYISETHFFKPDMSGLNNFGGERHQLLLDRSKTQEVFGKLREMYQYSAASVLRGVKIEENLVYLDKVLSRAENVARGTVSYPLWSAAAALSQALVAGTAELSVAVRGLLRQLLRELQGVEEQGPSALDKAPREGLIRNLLYYIALVDDHRPLIAQIKQRFGLTSDSLVGAGTPSAVRKGLIAQPDPEAIRAVVLALQDELNTCKHLLDLAISSQGLSDLQELAPIIKRISDTLAVLGVGDMRLQMMAQYDSLITLIKTGKSHPQTLMDVAGHLASLENRLDAMAKGAGKVLDYGNLDERAIELDSAKKAVLTECRAGLETVKEVIVEAMSHQWSVSELPKAVETLHMVKGGMMMVPLPHPAKIAEACGQYIRDQLMRRVATPAKELPLLAEALASIDYYIERLLGGYGDNLEGYLNLADAALKQLGVAVAEAADRANIEQVETLEDTFQHEDLERIQPLSVPEVEVEPNIPFADDKTVLAAPEILEDDDSDDDVIDDEIIDIFVEEVAEVLTTLYTYLPKWAQNLNDEESLMVVRRSFHTLKGSGRMVEAKDVGELGWAVENMLNRVLDRSIKAHPAQIQLIEQVLAVVPDLVNAFKDRTANPLPERCQLYTEQANALASGTIPAALDTGGYQDAAPQVSHDVQEDIAEPAMPDIDEEDQILWEIFASEALTHLTVLDAYIEDMKAAAPLYEAPTDILQRALHTLKGSAHMAAVTPIATLMTSLETFVKELRNYQVRIDRDILQLLEDASLLTREGLEHIYARKPVTISKLELFVARVQELHARHLEPLIHSRDDDNLEKHKVDPKLLSIFMAEDMQWLLDADRLLVEWSQAPEPFRQAIEPLSKELASLAEGAHQANLPEMTQAAQLLLGIYQNTQAHPSVVQGDYFEALIKGHEGLLDMVDQVAAGQRLHPFSDVLRTQLESFLLVPPSETLLQSLDSSNFLAGEWEPDHLEDAADLGVLETNSDTSELSVDSALIIEEPEEFTAKDFEFDDGDIDFALSEESIDPASLEPVDLEPVDLESMGLEPVDLESMGLEPVDLESMDLEPMDLEPMELEADAHTPLEAVLVPGLEDNASPYLEHELTVDLDTSVLPILIEDHFEDDNLENAASFISDESTLVETALEVGSIEESTLEESILKESTTEESIAEFEPMVMPSDSVAVNEPISAVFQPENHYVVEVSTPNKRSDALSSEAWAVAQIDLDEYDEDILEIFLEEAGELTEALDEAISTWSNHRTSTEAPDAMKRALHTLKGGARLAGLKNMGELAHQYESFLMASSDPDADVNHFTTLLAYQDQLLNGLKAVRATLDGKSPPDVLHHPLTDESVIATSTSDVDSGHEVIATLEAEGPAIPAILPKRTDAIVVPLRPKTPAPEFEQTFMATVGQQDLTPQNKRAGNQEMIKVSADLLEELVNLAGETSISRGRLQQQIMDLSNSVHDVDGTLRRLNEQLRRLGIETEAQVLFRQERMAAYEHFDPLEMDRYSHLQQLTRSLMESASDLMDLKTTLTDKIRDTETLLLQQSRINSALQEGLMRSRMVPFSRLVPRLRRIVRQVAGELGKQVDFELDNVEGEMDRSVLERMIAPLEHMLRNAVDHGIEQPATRVRSNKPETGRILLSLAREGGDILLRLADDGQGINLERVRAKAIERGLMLADVDLSPHDIMQFILQAGFSTAEHITHISGRGVGMDVVAAEIKQLGGTIVIDSKAGVGSQFTVRLPFTVSVNRALMVQLNQEVYAIPLNTIEGIVRVSPFELEHYYAHPDARFEYAGENYQVHHLGAMLNRTSPPKLEGQVLPLPVLLVRTAQHTMALQVDGLKTSREIVVKSLGPQFAAVVGLSGATVMGDGSVVIILDPHALVRREIALNSLPNALQANAALPAALVDTAPSQKTIMVVDDSVTVRKVMTRFLEREGFKVIIAKDGLDALQVLQDQTPDLMLLDIEMPRMDGFEVAKNLRSSSRLKHLPIIMITSRTGDKHRQHALSIGVNEYLGKPYQEDVLLASINQLISSKTKRRS